MRTLRQPRLGASRTVCPCTRPGHGQRGAGQVQPERARRPRHQSAASASTAIEHGRRRARTLVGAQHLAVADRAGQVDHARGQIVDVDLEAEAGRAAGVERQPDRRPPGAGLRRGCDLDHQPAGDEVVDERGHGRPGEPGGGRDVGAGRPVRRPVTCRSTSARLCSRRLACRTGAAVWSVRHGLDSLTSQSNNSSAKQIHLQALLKRWR